MKQVRILRALLAIVVPALVVAPVALATAHGGPTLSGPAAKKAAAAKKKAAAAQKKALALLNSVKGEAAAISSEIDAMKSKLAALSAPPPTPAPVPPAGPAGGVLGGSYPNPTLRPNSINSDTVADGSLTGSDLAANTIQSSNLANGAFGSQNIIPGSITQSILGIGSVGPSQLVGTDVVKNGPDPVNGGGNGTTGELTATCPPGERLLAGGAEWSSTVANLFIDISEPKPVPLPTENPNQWYVKGFNKSGGQVGLFALALCLRAG